MCLSTIVRASCSLSTESATTPILFTQAGFVLDASSDILRQPGDDRSKAFFSPQLKGKPTDRFVLRFKKPL